MEFKINKKKSMKNNIVLIKSITVVFFVIVLNITIQAQHNHAGMSSGSTMNSSPYRNMNSQPAITRTGTLIVNGKCSKCKTRIEDIAYAAGASSAEWNIKTKYLVLSYDPQRSSPDYVAGKLAKAGYDNEHKKAKDKAYNALPDCCKYDRLK